MKKFLAVHVTVPASTSNLGPGFDCLGLALKLRNELTLELRPKPGPTIVEISGEGASSLPRGEKNLVVQAARLVIPKKMNRQLVFRCLNRIPLARGLGSSAAAAVAGLWAAAHLFSTLPLSEDKLEEMAIGLEGHPDNVAPCVHGGLTASFNDNGKVHSTQLLIDPQFMSVVCIPAFELSTKKARLALPKKVPLQDAVFNSSRTLLLARALEKGQTRNLNLLMNDRLHQPYRAKLVPGLNLALSAAVKAGAFGAALSGSGPTVFALAKQKNCSRVGKAMTQAFLTRKIRSKSLSLQIDTVGVSVERS